MMDSPGRHRAPLQAIQSELSIDQSQEAKRRQKAMSAGAAADAQNQASAADSEDKAEMDQMRCILYAHGGVFRCLL